MSKKVLNINELEDSKSGGFGLVEEYEYSQQIRNAMEITLPLGNIRYDNYSEKWGIKLEADGASFNTIAKMQESSEDSWILVVKKEKTYKKHTSQCKEEVNYDADSEEDLGFTRICEVLEQGLVIDTHPSSFWYISFDIQSKVSLINKRSGKIYIPELDSPFRITKHLKLMSFKEFIDEIIVAIGKNQLFYCGYTIVKHQRKINKQMQKSHGKINRSLRGKFHSTFELVDEKSTPSYLNGDILTVMSTTAFLALCETFEEPMKSQVLAVSKLITSLFTVVTSSPGLNRRLALSNFLLIAGSTPHILTLVESYLKTEPTLEAGIMNSDFTEVFTNEDPQTMSGIFGKETLVNGLQSTSDMLKGPLFDHLDSLIALMVTIGFINEDLVTIKGIRLFQTGFSKLCPSREILTRVIDAIKYLGTMGQKIFEKRSFAPLFDLEDDLSSFAKNVTDICSKVEIYKQGNYELLEGQDESHFVDYIQNTIDQGEQVTNSYASSSVSITSYIRSLNTRVLSAQNEVKMDQLARGSREKPLCIKYFGDSGVGKTYVNLKCMIEILRMNDFPYTQRNIAVKSNEKFDTTVKTNTTGIIIDDMCNTRAEKETVNPIDSMIRIVNNVASTAVKAEAHEKGKVILLPKVLGITTNVRELNASYWSQNEASVLRRADLHVDVALRSCFINKQGFLNSDLALKSFADDEVSDIYLLSVYTYSTETGSLELVKFNCGDGKYSPLIGRDMHGISLPMFLNYLQWYSKKFYKDQKRVLDKLNKTHAPAFCEECSMCFGACSCKDVELTDLVEECLGKMPNIKSPVDMKLLKPLRGRMNSLFSVVTYSIVKPWGDELSSMCNWWLKNTVEVFIPRRDHLSARMLPVKEWFSCYYESDYAWHKIIPRSVVSAIVSTHIGRTVVQRSINADLNASYSRALGMWTFLFGAINWKYNLFREKSVMDRIQSTLVLGLFVAWFQKSMRSARVTSFFDNLVKNPSTEKVVYDQITNYLLNRKPQVDTALNVFKYALVGSSLIFAAVKVYEVLQQYGSENGNMHGILSPETLEQYEVRNVERVVWGKPQLSSTKSSSSHSNMLGHLSKNVVNIFIRACNSKVGLRSVAIWLRNDTLMFNKHNLYDSKDGSKDLMSEFEFKLVRSPIVVDGKYMHGSEYKVWKPATKDDLYFVNDDWVILHTHALSGSVNDLTTRKDGFGSYFATEESWKNRSLLTVIKRDIEGRIIVRNETISRQDRILIKQISDDGIPTGAFFGFPAFCIKAQESMKSGDCGSLAFDRGNKDFAICGFYSSNIASNNEDVFNKVTAEDISKYLSSRETHFSHEFTLGEFNSESFGVKLPMSHIIPTHSPLNYGKVNAIVHGHIPGSNHYKTTLRKTVLYDLVSSTYNLSYAPPDFINSRPFDGWIQSRGQSNNYMQSTLLHKCKMDYLSGLRSCFNKNLIKDIRPLTKLEIINGQDGVRFINAMNKGTAIGHPFSGKLRKHLIPVHGIGVNPIYDFSDTRIWDTFNTMLEEYRSGNTLSQPFKATLKDELRKTTKLIPRVFFAAPLSTKLCMRRYYLPLTRFLSSFPLVSECAVGINCMSDEWEQMSVHIEKYGVDRIVAGDFKNWDIGFEKELTVVVFDILLEIAQWYGYDEDDLLIMRGIAQDMCNPTLNVFGTIITVDGSNPSGQNLTAYVNSIGNSIRMRYYAFLIEERVFDFRSNISLITYGDDFICSVSENVKFTYARYKKILKEHNITLTLPDKSDLNIDAPDFMVRKNQEFLKRSSVYVEELGFRVGALDVNSIWKSLLYYKCDSCETEVSIFRSTVESICYELLPHGESYYEKGIAFLKGCCLLYDIKIDNLDLPYKNKIKALSTDFVPLPE